MQTISADLSYVVWSVCVLVTTMSPAKMVEPGTDREAVWLVDLHWHGDTHGRLVADTIEQSMLGGGTAVTTTANLFARNIVNTHRRDTSQSDVCFTSKPDLS